MGKAFFGGGTYFKLSKRDNEEMYKFEYCHQSLPNYIPEAEKYIKKYDTLKVEDNHFKEYFNGKISEVYLNINKNIKKIFKIINNTNWTNIIKKTYTSMDLDDINWDFYIENGTKKEVYKQGYSVYPKEIVKILTIFKNMKDDYIGKKWNKMKRCPICRKKLVNIVYGFPLGKDYEEEKNIFRRMYEDRRIWTYISLL